VLRSQDTGVEVIDGGGIAAAFEAKTANEIRKGVGPQQTGDGNKRVGRDGSRRARRGMGVVDGLREHAEIDGERVQAGEETRNALGAEAGRRDMMAVMRYVGGEKAQCNQSNR